MIPPRGLKADMFPLRHKLINSVGLSAVTSTMNTVFFPLVMGSTDVDVIPSTIHTNPHNSDFTEDAGPLVRQHSILDRLTLSLRFNLTENCADRAHTSGVAAAEVFSGDSVQHLRFLWRPIFGSFPEKLAAADDETTTTVAAILGLTSDDTNEDVVPITTTKLPVIGESDLNLATSTVNAVQVKEDFNMSTNVTMEAHDFEENLFQDAIRRYTNKGALKACVGRTRYVNLTRRQPFKNFFIQQFVPRAIRRVVDRTFMGIQVHVPVSTDIAQDYHAVALTESIAHLGVKMICRYHEWHVDHDSELGTPT